MKNISHVRKVLLVIPIFLSALTILLSANMPRVGAYPTKSELLSASFKFTAINTIQMDAGGETYYFVDNDPYDFEYEYVIRDYGSGFGKIKLPRGYEFFGVQGGGGSAIKADIDIDYFPNDTATADIDDDDLEREIVVGDASKVRTIMRLDANNPDVMTRLGEGGWQFERVATDSEPFMYRRTSEAGDVCQDVAIVQNGTVTVYELKDGGDPKAPAETGDTGCQVLRVNFLDVYNVPDVSVFSKSYSTLFGPFLDADGNIITSGARAGLFGASALSGVDPTDAPDPAATNDPDAQEDVENCESKTGGLGFILCELLGLTSDGISWMDERIMNALDVNEDYYNNESVRGAWTNFRNVAYLLLIPVMLVMVIGTALNFSFVDAYTVKRAMPRLLAAIIFITLSFQITRLMVDVFNVIGQGTGGLIAAPFGGVDNLQLTDVFSADTGDSAVAFTGVLAGVGVAALSGVTVGSLLVTAGLAALAIFIVFALLTLREMLIVFLIVVSPIAIIAWIFPGNDKPWKLWWQAFSKMLYFYPIVIGIIFIGRGFASIVNSTDSDEIVVVTTIIKLVAFVGPYFFIPKAFQFAGGALGNIAGMVNDRGKGVFDRGRKLRDGMKGEQRQQIKRGGGGVFGIGKNSAVGKKFGSAGASAYGLGRAVKSEGLIGGVNRSSIRSAKGKNFNEAAAEIAEKDADFAAFAADDNILKAIQAIKDRGEKVDRGSLTKELMTTHEVTDEKGNVVKKQLYGERFKDAKIAGDTATLVNQSRSQMGEGTFDRAALHAKAKAGTYFDDMGHMAREIAQVYGDDRMGAGGAIMAMKGLSMNAGRADLGGGGAGATLGALQDTYDMKTNGKTSKDITKEYVNKALNDQPPSSFSHPSMKNQFIEDNVIPVMQERIQNAYNKMNDESLSGVEREQAKLDYTREVAAAENLHNSLKQTKPSMANLFAEKVMAYDASAGRPLTAQEQRAAQESDSGTIMIADSSGSITPHKPRTIRQETYTMASDPVYADHQRQWQDQQNRIEQERAMATAAAEIGARPGGGPVVPPLGGR